MLEVSQHEGVKAMRNDFYFGWLSGGPRLYCTLHTPLLANLDSLDD